jgi:hypothetical protein
MDNILRAILYFYFQSYIHDKMFNTGVGLFLLFEKSRKIRDLTISENPLI